MPLAVRIRKATADDAPDIWALRVDAIRHDCRQHYPAELLRSWTAGEVTSEFINFVASKFYVAMTNESIAGTGVTDLTSGQIDAIFVQPKMMRQGIGRQMLVHLENLAKAAGLTQLSLEATLNAAPFYRRCGFVGETIGTYESPRGISLECIPMTKSLKD